MLFLSCNVCFLSLIDCFSNMVQVRNKTFNFNSWSVQMLDSILVNIKKSKLLHDLFHEKYEEVYSTAVNDYTAAEVGTEPHRLEESDIKKRLKPWSEGDHDRLLRDWSPESNQLPPPLANEIQRQLDHFKKMIKKGQAAQNIKEKMKTLQEEREAQKKQEEEARKAVTLHLFSMSMLSVICMSVYQAMEEKKAKDQEAETARAKDALVKVAAKIANATGGVVASEDISKLPAFKESVVALTSDDRPLRDFTPGTISLFLINHQSCLSCCCCLCWCQMRRKRFPMGL